ncbi:MAG: ASKHA domain-containing protein, partial [Thermodesulfobacteriota bacterium]
MTTKSAMVVFQPSGRRGQVPRGISIVEASRLLGVDIEAPCGEKIVCGKCKIRIEQGTFQKLGLASKLEHAGPWQSGEEKYISGDEKEEGYRLGCMATVEGDLLIFVPEAARAGKQVVSKAPRPLDIALNPAVKQYSVQLEPPTLEDPTGNFERLCEALEKSYGLTSLSIDLSVLRTLQEALEKGNWRAMVSVWMDREIILVQPHGDAPIFGMAIDIGTTTVAAYLCDLVSGKVIDTLSMMNPQVKYGEDVVSRISFHMENSDGLKRMSTDLVDGLNSLVDQAVSKTYTRSAPDDRSVPEQAFRINPREIVDVSIVGNTAMHHILLQLDPAPLGEIPFTPAVHHSLNIKARDLGLAINPAACVFMLPIEAGFVGGDNIGVILAEEPHNQNATQLIIDIGTNGELVLGNQERLVSSSCATGPALEGAQIKFGMRAAPGAIERVVVDPETLDLDYKVIGRDAWKNYSAPQDMQAKGICGSGILDAVAQLYLAGIVQKSGAFSKTLEKDRFRICPETGMKEFVLAWAQETSIAKDIAITQQDIRHIQLAKASIYTGCKLMMRKLGVDKVDRVKIAGAFGSHVDCKLALVMGMFPDCAVENIRSVGNAAGDGCRAALLDRDKRLEANRIARQVEYIELTLEEDFQRHLMEAIQFPHMKDTFEHL